MEFKLTSGCVCDYLGINGLREVDMTNEQREYYNNIICDFLKTKPQDLNYLLQYILPQYGDFDIDDKPCECCRDYVYSYTLNIDVDNN